MGATTLADIPAVFRAGDTFLVQIDLGDYPASRGWGVNYTFRRLNCPDLSFSSTANGDAHLITVDYGTTQAWAQGVYAGEGRVSDGTQRFCFWEGSMEILPDLSLQDPNFDGRSHARKMLEAIEAVLENRATKAILATTIAGQSITRYSPEQLLAMRSQYLSEVRAEEFEEGRGDSGNAVVRFTQP